MRDSALFFQKIASASGFAVLELRRVVISLEGSLEAAGVPQRIRRAQEKFNSW